MSVPARLFQWFFLLAGLGLLALGVQFSINNQSHYCSGYTDKVLAECVAEKAEYREAGVTLGLFGLGLQVASVSVAVGGRRPAQPAPWPQQPYPQPAQY